MRILKTKGTEAEAKANCSLMDSTSTLVTIGSKTEQDYLNEHLKSYQNISDNVWIGLEYVSRSFQWIDGTQYQYQNWGENAIKDGSNRCVKMSLTDNDLGQWTDDNCNRKYLIVCQKKQSRKSVLNDEVKNMKIEIDKLKSDMATSRTEIKNLQQCNKQLLAQDYTQRL